MGIKQNVEGRKAENEVANLLTSYRYWGLPVQKGPNGQPFDIVACRDNIPWFLDVKHLESNKNVFNFDRIEPNQKTSMKYAKNFAGNKNLGFVIVLDRESFKYLFLHYDKFVELEQKGYKSVKLTDLENFEDIIA